MKLSQKILIAFFGFIIIPLFLVGLTGYYIALQFIEEKYSEQTKLTLNAVSQNIRYIVQDINNFSDSWIVSNDIQTLFKEPVTTELSKIKAEKTILQSLLTHPNVQVATLYNFNDEIVTSAKNENLYSIPFERLVNSEVYEKMFGYTGRPIWVTPYENETFSAAQNLYTHVRVVKDFYTLEDLGMIMLQVELRELMNIFKSYEQNGQIPGQHFLLVNDQGTIFFDQKNLYEGRNIFDLLSTELSLNERFTSYKSDFDGEESIVSSYQLRIEEMIGGDWHLVSVTSWAFLTEETNSILKWIALITSFCIISALLFNLFFVRGIVQSIIQIVKAMRRAEKGHLNVMVSEKGNDERTVLARGFNHLIQRIRSLIEEVKQEQDRKNKAELMLMQAQIKPHFLFNTLESINVLAIQNEGEKVSQMVQRLGNILRISFHEQEEIHMKQEIEHVRSYLEIQKFRFIDHFDYEFDIQEEILKSSILKLTLQPFVENSIQHAFESAQHKGKIRIIGKKEGDRIAIYIEDNGKGIPNKILEKFQYGQDLIKDQLSHDITNGLGIKNVAERLRIHYGMMYGVFICSDEHGTTIKCVIPLDKDVMA
ncbi:cache domain-containing sensor histidine kinase [Chengkuizengella axinellae]|uniref:Sensor histidine kinase n=1 Tax=Chengkuizengella axinellae TaxID=3064388 RepID=A0ABT9J224_9BACL|nr:sensor histidine kinase [Chengkuizengella sp. 2205SS18-9]MDP5275659.1 sensor histidine kinase [Chengkuizengella sp. 2205SS18-9]